METPLEKFMGDDRIKVTVEKPVPIYSRFTVVPDKRPSVDFDLLETALKEAGKFRDLGVSTHIEMALTYDDAVKLVKQVKTRRVRLWLTVSQFAPDAGRFGKDGWHVSGFVPVTRGAVLRFLQEAYTSKHYSGRAMVRMGLYTDCLFIGAGA